MRPRRQQSFGMVQKETVTPPKPEEQSSGKGLQFVILPDGTDAKFLTGVNSGRWVSELVKTVEGRDFLGAVWKSGKRDLQNVIRRFFSD